MFRPSIAALTAALFLTPARAGDQVSPAPAKPAISTVYFAQSADAVEQFQENTAVTRRMVDQLVMDVTGQSSVAGAWRTLVSPNDRVGIKVATAGAPYCVSHPGVVEAIVAGLEQAGIPRKKVIVWDRDPETLRAAGFDGHGGYSVRAIDPPRGYDREATYRVGARQADLGRSALSGKSPPR